MSGHARPGGRRRSRGHEEEEHVNHERWLVSYSDMITVLMALFIVLFAISQVDQGKYQALRESLAAGFGEPKPSVLTAGQGVLAGSGDAPEVNSLDVLDNPVQMGDPAEQAPADLELARQEVQSLTQLQQQITEILTAHGLQDSVRFRIDQQGLVMGLVADDVFFAAASAQLTPGALEVLDAAAPVLRALPNDFSVEGHANVLPVNGRYATNWELSADRATQVLRRLVEVDGIAPTRISSTGYGDSRPLMEGMTPEALAANRRVDLVILSTQPEAVRALLPVVVAPTADPAAVAPTEG